MTSLSATTASGSETSDLATRRSLGNRLSSWQKKSTRVTLNAQFTISAETNEVESARETFSPTDGTGPEGVPRVTIHTSGERWAKAWMRKLRRRKKTQNSEVPETKPTVLTLAEQLRKAQTEELCLDDCQVISQQSRYLNCRCKPPFKYCKTPPRPRNSSRNYHGYLRPRQYREKMLQRDKRPRIIPKWHQMW